ncbi:hypothetical protein [Pantoea anthophila]|uniref:hypothetical protein n=1 Tax=Pantoea anthophila TaxID=470931 RepID=UPI0006964D69|nr:hypothetical protein [Pantoea anthophila]
MSKAIKFYVSDRGSSGLLLNRTDCKQLPDKQYRAFIGSCYSLVQALSMAKRSYTEVGPCPYCVVLPDIKTAKSDASDLFSIAKKPNKK